MSDNKDILDRVNATLDRFALLVEENAQRTLKSKEEYDRQRAEDQAEWERRNAELSDKIVSVSEQVGGKLTESVRLLKQ